MPPSAHRPTLAIMAKAPALGRVKTRLAREVGGVEALRFYRASVARLLRRLGPDPRWRTLLAVAPDVAAGTVAPWMDGVDVIAPQGEGGLGDRMQLILDACPPGPAVIIGCDIPAIRPHHIAKAFRALGSHDAVFGPAGDGGYWLIGLKRVPRIPRLFENVRWSSGDALNDTLANTKGLRVAMIDTLNDVDNGADYAAWRKQEG